MNKNVLYINIYLHCVLLFIVLSSLFYFYIARITTKITTNSVMHEIYKRKEIIKDIIQNKQDLLKESDYDYYFNLFSKEDDNRKRINDQLFYYIKIICILFIFGFIFLSMYFLYDGKIDLYEFKIVLFENVITFLFIFIVEYFFYISIIRNYVPLKSNEIEENMIESIKKCLQRKTK